MILRPRVSPWLCLACIFSVAVVSAQDSEPAPFPKADPEDFGLRLPRAAPKPGGERRVVVPREGAEPVVGNVLIEVGDRFVVTMPSGRLVSVIQNEVSITERPFRAASKAEIIKSLKEKFRDFKTGSTKRYVYVYNTSPQFHQAASRILETMYPALVAYCKRNKLTVHDPATPLVVVMFRTQEEYQRYHKMPAEVAAYYNSVSNYVVMYEQSKFAEVAPALAVRQSISTIAHEGVHQILHNIGVQKRLSQWPMWISEGLPEFFAPTDLGRRVRWAGVGKANHLRMRNLKELLASQPAELADGGLIKQTISGERLTAAGYASAWAMTDFLAKRRKAQFFAFLHEVSQLEPLGEAPDRVALFEKHFGADYAELQKNVILHLKKLPYVDPILNQPHYVAVIDAGNRRTLMISSSPAAIQKWRDRYVSELPQGVRNSARLNVRVYANKALAERAARLILN